jgi:hypothetical protein
VEIVGIADAERAEHQDVGTHAGLAERRALLDVGAGQEVGAGVLERPADLRGAVAVRVGLDDADDAGRPRRLLAGEMVGDRAVVRLEDAEIDAGDGRPDPGSRRRGAHLLSMT